MNPLESALKMIREGRASEGIAALDALIDDPRWRRDALGHRAHYHLVHGNGEAARHDYGQLVGLDPDDMQFRLYLAEALLSLGLYDEAVRQTLDVLARDIWNDAATRLLLKCQEASGKVKPLPPLSPGQLSGPSQTINPVISLLESGPRTFPISVHPGIGRVLYTLVRLLRPTLMIETGSFVGYSSICIAQAMEDNGSGHLHCFDLFMPLENNYTSPVVGRTDDRLAAARGHIQAAGVDHRITLHKGDSSSNIRRILGDRPGAIQMAFIDGDHTLKGALKDWAAVDELLAEGGIVMLHDTFPETCGWYGPRAIIEELSARAPGDYQSINLPTADRLGIALIQKRRKGPGPSWRAPLTDLIAQRLFMAVYWSKTVPP